MTVRAALARGPLVKHANGHCVMPRGRTFGTMMVQQLIAAGEAERDPPAYRGQLACVVECGRLPDIHRCYKRIVDQLVNPQGKSDDESDRVSI